MFSGIIESVGHIQSIVEYEQDSRFEFAVADLDIADLNKGDSIAVNGACLTLLDKTANGFTADLSKETLALTTFNASKQGDKINLERALMLSDRLNGHIVSGHVDGIGIITDISEVGRSWQFTIQSPLDLMPFITKKGSICIDGVSLTVNMATKDSFQVNIIPHTMHNTCFVNYQNHSRVNLEVDLIARYVQSLHQ